MRTICIGDLSEKDLGLIKDFFENKYGKTISRKSFENYLQLSTGQHKLFEEKENPFGFKPLRYFEGPLLDIEVEIERFFSLDKVYAHYTGSYSKSHMYCHIKKEYINESFFPQDNFFGISNIARLQIGRISKLSSLGEITELAEKEIKPARNLSKFLFRVLHNLAVTQPELLRPFNDSNIILPLVSKKSAHGDYPLPMFTKREHDGKYIWDFNWKRVNFPAGYYVALLSQK